jgi:hypothetical protein
MTPTVPAVPGPSAVEAGVTVLSDRTAARTVSWAAWLFALLILVQRFSVPGMPVPMLLPVCLAWIVLAWRAGVAEIDLRRLQFWASAVAITGAVMLVQTALHPQPVISVTSWALIHVVWLPAVMRFVDRRPSTFVALLHRIVAICAVLSVACVFMIAVQFAGVPYQDYLAAVIPETFLEQGFTIASPITFGSPIYRANAWIGLEPSTVSYQIGIGILAAILVRARMRWFLVLVAGIFATVGASGFVLVGLGLLALLAFPARRSLLRILAPVVVGGSLALATPVGQILQARGENAGEDQSAFLRAVQPYTELWPQWSTDLTTALLGGGAGSSQRIVDVTIEQGLVPLPAKIFFDYGLIAGLVLAAFLMFCYVDSLSATIAFAFMANLWTVQPGSNIPVFVVPVVLLVTMWAPRSTPRLEDLPAPPAPPPRARRRHRTGLLPASAWAVLDGGGRR